jgi:hypothetical protein
MTLTQVVKAIFPHTAQTELFGELAWRVAKRNDAPPHSQKGAAMRPLFVLVGL